MAEDRAGASRSGAGGAAGRGRLARVARLADCFAWPLRTSHYVELVNPRWSSHALRATVEEVWDETPDARTLRLRPGRGWRGHRAGQHVRLGVPVRGAYCLRTYSISSGPERADGCITITVKAVPSGRVSQHLVREVLPGASLWLGQAQGEFVLPDAGPTRALFVTAGSGVTPVMSMLRSLASRGALSDVVHLHYAPTPADVIFGDELARLANDHPGYRLHLVTTRVPGPAGAERGHFAAAQLETLCPDWRGRDAYACGPQSLLTDVEAHWAGAAPSSRLHVERFRAALAEMPADATGGRVRFARSDREIEADGRTSLLEAAERAGLRPAHGCRMGICHSCSVTLRAGCVRDLRNHTVIDEPGAKVQICVCAAAGDVELEA
jgi:ferredoxin-NADP reductase